MFFCFFCSASGLFSCDHSSLPLHSSPMTEREKMLAGELYFASDDELVASRARAQRLCKLYNESLERPVLSELLGECPADITVEASFKCDYGDNIYLGRNFYANFDLTILDVCEVRIGSGCLIGPKVGIYTATHPLDRTLRRSGAELGAPITIGDDCWIGGHAVINPGVTLGDNVIVAAGAVVTKSFGSHVVLGGVPAQVIKELDPE